MWKAYTDGSCQVHTSKCGGAAVVLIPPVGHTVESSFHVCNTTAQRMELEAVAEALDMTFPGAEVSLVTDSQYAYHVTVGDWTLKENLDIVGRIQRLAAERMLCIQWKPRNFEQGMKHADALSKTAASACPLDKRV